MSVELLENLVNSGNISVNQARLMKNIRAMKGGIVDAAGQTTGERFIGRNIEVILTGFFEGWTEAETLSKCEWIFD